MDQGAAGTSGLLPELHLDELLRQLQERLQAVLTTRDQMNGLLEAVVAIGSDLNLETMLRRIIEAAVTLAEARYGALGVIGEDGQLAEFVPVGLDEAQIGQIAHWPRGEGLLGRSRPASRPGTRRCAASSASRSGSAAKCSATCTSPRRPAAANSPPMTRR